MSALRAPISLGFSRGPVAGKMQCPGVPGSRGTRPCGWIISGCEATRRRGRTRSESDACDTGSGESVDVSVRQVDHDCPRPVSCKAISQHLFMALH